MEQTELLSTDAKPKRKRRICSVLACGKIAIGPDYCGSHGNRKYKIKKIQ